MDLVFDSGTPPWRGVPKGSRLDELQRDIEQGKIKARVGAAAVHDGRAEKE